MISYQPLDNKHALTQHDHTNMVSGLVKPGSQILAELTGGNYSAVIEAMKHGISASNIVDRVKKQFVYQKYAQVITHTDHPMINLTAEKMHLIHMAMGIFGEAGELLEAVYHHIHDGADLDTENCVEELGDIEFYMEGFRQGISVERSYTLNENINKLGVRYKGHQYSDQAAQTRADKAADIPAIPTT